jgi:ribosomal protein L32E
MFSRAPKLTIRMVEGLELMFIKTRNKARISSYVNTSHGIEMNKSANEQSVNVVNVHGHTPTCPINPPFSPPAFPP